MTRSLAKIDDWLYIERCIWQHERRARPDGPDTLAAMRRIDNLLDERNRAVDRLALQARKSPPSHL